MVTATHPKISRRSRRPFFLPETISLAVKTYCRLTGTKVTTTATQFNAEQDRYDMVVEYTDGTSTKHHFYKGDL